MAGYLLQRFNVKPLYSGACHNTTTNAKNAGTIRGNRTTAVTLPPWNRTSAGITLQPYKTTQITSTLETDTQTHVTLTTVYIQLNSTTTRPKNPISGNHNGMASNITISGNLNQSNPILGNMTHTGQSVNISQGGQSVYTSQISSTLSTIEKEDIGTTLLDDKGTTLISNHSGTDLTSTQPLETRNTTPDGTIWGQVTTELYNNTVEFPVDTISFPVGTMGPVTVDRTKTSHPEHEGDSLSTIQIATICFVALGVLIFIIVILARVIYWKSKRNSSRDAVITANQIHRPRVAYINRGMNEIEV